MCQFDRIYTPGYLKGVPNLSIKIIHLYCYVYINISARNIIQCESIARERESVCKGERERECVCVCVCVCVRERERESGMQHRIDRENERGDGKMGVMINRVL